MDHFRSASTIRSAITKLDHQVANPDLEAGSMEEGPQRSRSPQASSSIPSHISDELRASEFSAQKNRLD